MSDPPLTWDTNRQRINGLWSGASWTPEEKFIWHDAFCGKKWWQDSSATDFNLYLQDLTNRGAPRGQSERPAPSGSVTFAGLKLDQFWNRFGDMYVNGSVTIACADAMGRSE